MQSVVVYILLTKGLFVQFVFEFRTENIEISLAYSIIKVNFCEQYFLKSVKMAIAYYIPQSHHQQSDNSTATSSSPMGSSESTITIPINQGGSTCWELLAKVFCFALRFCHQTPSQGVLRITFECQTTSQTSSSSTTTTSENTTNKFKN